jgi:hypothetical protein
MPRDVSTANEAQLEAQFNRPCFLVSLEFADETVYAWTGLGDLSWDGNTYTGVGKLGDVSGIAEGSDVQADGIELTLSGADTSLLAEAMGQMQSGKRACVYFGFVDDTGHALVADPIPAFIGMLDQPNIDLGTETSTIVFSVENRLTDLNRARGGRLTDQDQRARYPDDGSLQYVRFLQDHRISWS